MQSQTLINVAFLSNEKKYSEEELQKQSTLKNMTTYAITSQSIDKVNEILEPQSARSEVNDDLNFQFDFRRRGIKYLNGIF